MNDFTEDDLSKALGDQVANENDPVTKDLLDEDTPDNNAGKPDGNEPADADPKPDDIADPTKDEHKPDDANPDQPDKNEPKPDDGADPDKKDESADTDPEPELIMGKFKNQDALIEAYKNLEKKLGEKAQESQEIKQVTSDDFDKAVDQKIVDTNIKAINKALDTISDPEKAKEAQYLWAQAQKTGNLELFEKARSYLDSRIDRRLEAEMMNNAAQIRMSANAHKEEILLKPLSAELDKMAEEDPEFMNDAQNQELLAMAIKLNPTKVNVRVVKKTIQNYGKTQYDKGYEAAKKEFAKQVETKSVSVKTTPKAVQPAPKKDTSSMSIEDQLKEEYKDLELL